MRQFIVFSILLLSVILLTRADGDTTGEAVDELTTIGPTRVIRDMINHGQQKRQISADPISDPTGQIQASESAAAGQAAGFGSAQAASQMGTQMGVQAAG